MRKIYTHVQPDLDAACSVWAVKRFAHRFSDALVVFKGADWDGKELEPLDMAVDIDAGGKGFKGEAEGDLVKSAFSLVVNTFAGPDEMEVMAPLCEYLDIHDSKGSVGSYVARDGHGAKLVDYFGLSRVWSLFRGAHGGDDRTAINEFGRIVLDGLLEQGLKKRREIPPLADKCYIVGDVALVVDKPWGVNGELFNRGVRMIVYVDGFNLGVCRRGDQEIRCDHPAIREVVEREGEEWFAHVSGFVYGWGTRKSPKSAPSRVQPSDLFDGVLRALAIHDRENAA